jgi:uncharacterized cupin superfamily protein
MTTPPNVFRPRPQDWQTSSWGAPFTTRSLEWRDHLPLRSLGGHLTTVEPGGRTCPMHAHYFEEEVFGVLDGTLSVRELVAGASGYRSFALRAGEVIVYPPGTGLAHGFWNESDAPVTFFGVSDEAPGEVATYPESGKTQLRALRTVGTFGPDESEAVIRAANAVAAARPMERLADRDRPDHVVTGVPERDLGGAFGRRLSALGGARRVFLNRDRLPPGTTTSPLHWHSADEEIVLVLKGSPTLVMRPGVVPAESGDGRPSGGPDFAGRPDARWPLEPGDVVAFGPHVPMAHRLVNDADGDAELMVVGLDRDDDLIVFPDEGRVWVKALGRSAPMRATPYFAGELPPPRR